MKIWIDAHLSPAIAVWMAGELNPDTWSSQRLGLLAASDIEIFERAREQNAVILTKDSDFVDLVNRGGPPPRVVWLSCGSTTNLRLREILATQWLRVATLHEERHPVVDLTDSIGD